jgi:hypothetical protein
VIKTQVFSSLLDSVAAVLAVKGALRRAQQRRALDRSGPLQTRAPLREEKQKQKTSPPARAGMAVCRFAWFCAWARLFPQKFGARMP